MVSLTDRQIQLLKAIIEEYIETAEPVGSERLDKKYGLGVSPATIRNEMVRLTESGFLKQPYTSAGRIPTSMALKFYVNNLMKQKDLSVSEEVGVKQRIWDYRQEVDRLLREITKVLADKTHALALTTTNAGDIYYAGAANILEMPEFFDIDMTRNLLLSLDEFDFWWNLLGKTIDDRPYYVLLEEELGRSMLYHCGLIYTHVRTPRIELGLGIIGPSRLAFSQVIPFVTYCGSLLTEVL